MRERNNFSSPWKIIEKRQVEVETQEDVKTKDEKKRGYEEDEDEDEDEDVDVWMRKRPEESGISTLLLLSPLPLQSLLSPSEFLDKTPK